MGDLGINAATEYENGTPLTDALYGIRYYMDIKDIDQKEKDAHPEKIYFHRFASRYDMNRYFTEKVYEDERYIVYKNPNSFPLAFATNDWFPSSIRCWQRRSAGRCSGRNRWARSGFRVRQAKPWRSP